MIGINLYEVLVENDLNPFILFDNNGKLKDFNKEAEFLFNFVSYKDLFELAISYASKNYGINKKYIQLSYGKSKYYAILVVYLTEEEIALKLYKEVNSASCEKQLSKDIEFVNVYSLIELAKSSLLIENDIDICEIYDVSIPDIKLDINKFVIVLNGCFCLYKSANSLKLKVYIKTGEYEVIQDIKYKILCIEFLSNINITTVSKILKENALKSNIDIFLENNSIKLELPMIV